MKKRLSIFIGALLYGVTLKSQDNPYMEHLPDYIENLSIFEQSQEPGRCYCMLSKHTSSDDIQEFIWNDVPQNISTEFSRSKFNDRSQDNIEIPSNWEMLGYDDKMFRNISAPFRVNVPFVPGDYNSTGAYRREFQLSDDWNGHQVFLWFEGVAFASFVWINGYEVGHNEGAQESTKHSITHFLKSDKNTIIALVLKYSDGFLLEGQDYWRLSGIFDDVSIYTIPPVRLLNWYVRTTFDKHYISANLDVEVNAKEYKADNISYLTLKGELCDKAGKYTQSLPSTKISLQSVGNETVMSRTEVKQPLKQTAETPSLYTLRLSLYGEDGQLIDKNETKIGSKQAKTENGVFYLNGVSVKINTQSSHTQYPEQGYMMKENVVHQGPEILKQFNFNTVRISHYLSVNKHLELVSEYGLYVTDEAGVEARATEWVSKKSESTDMYCERVRKVVLRDRNYPCILFWSAGNESGEGFNTGKTV